MPLLMAALGGAVLAAPPPPPLGFQPNILLLFPDEWRFDWDGFREDNGAVPLAVPNLRAFAAKGTRFQHAYVPAPVCATRVCVQKRWAAYLRTCMRKIISDTCGHACGRLQGRTGAYSCGTRIGKLAHVSTMYLPRRVHGRTQEGEGTHAGRGRTNTQDA